MVKLPDLEALKINLRSKLNRNCYCYIFQGDRIFLSSPPFVDIVLPEGKRVPLVETQTTPINEEGLMVERTKEDLEVERSGLERYVDLND